MKPEKVNEIMSKVMEHWTKRLDINRMDKEKIKALRMSLLSSPYEDGFMRVVSMETQKTHLVPFEDVILFGLKGKDLEKYPLAKGGGYHRNV